MKLQSNQHKKITLATTQEWSSWEGGQLIKHLYKTTTNQMPSFLAGLSSKNFHFDKIHASIWLALCRDLFDVTIGHLSNFNYLIATLTSLLHLPTYLWFITVFQLSAALLYWVA